MSDKTGKGFKSSLKSKTSKDDSSPKPKKTSKVHFDHNTGKSESRFKTVPESDDQFEGFTSTPSKESRGGKGSSRAKKSSVPKETQPLELQIENEIPENAKYLMDCEAFQFLQGIKEQITVLSEDPTIKIPVSFDRGLEYMKYGSCYATPQSVRQILDPLKKHGVSEGEMCMIANVCPETADEVFAFVPSMKGRKDKISQPLEETLAKLSKIKKST